MEERERSIRLLHIRERKSSVKNLERRLSRAGTYTDSTFWFDIHIAVFAVVIAAAALLVLNTIWKIRLMKQEKQLIEAGKAVSA